MCAREMKKEGGRCVGAQKNIGPAMTILTRADSQREDVRVHGEAYGINENSMEI